MANRIIQTKVKVKALSECLRLFKVKESAQKHGISVAEVYVLFGKIKASLPETLAKQKPGPKRKNKPQKTASPQNEDLFPNELPLWIEVASSILNYLSRKLEQKEKQYKEDRPRVCLFCQGRIIWKNGHYLVFNWIKTLTLGRFTAEKCRIQRFLCAHCRRAVHSSLPQRIKLARLKFLNSYYAKGVAFGKFGLGLSQRNIQSMLEFFLGLRGGFSTINSLIQLIGKRAEEFNKKVKDLPQRSAILAFVDETFANFRGKTKSLAVLIDKFGYIRLLKYLGKKNQKTLNRIFKEAKGKWFNPEVILSDFGKGLPSMVKYVFGNVKHYFCLVHAQRIIYRAFQEALRETVLIGGNKLSPKERKKLLRTKKKVLRSVLGPIIKRITASLKTAKKRGISLTIKERRQILGQALKNLKQFQYPNVIKLSNKLDKFFNKYSEVLFELIGREDLPNSTNEMEGSIGLVKRYLKVMDQFQSMPTGQPILEGIACYRNFLTLERGPNKGTSAIERAGIQTNCKNFYEVVGLSPPHKTNERFHAPPFVEDLLEDFQKEQSLLAQGEDPIPHPQRVSEASLMIIR